MGFLREEMPEETASLDDDGLLNFIVDAEACAAKHGIESDRGIAQYACLAMAVGPAFADIPLMAAFLKVPGTEPEQQLETLIEFMDLHLGEEEDDTHEYNES
jgi:hypothetical protein